MLHCCYLRSVPNQDLVVAFGKSSSIQIADGLLLSSPRGSLVCRQRGERDSCARRRHPVVVVVVVVVVVAVGKKRARMLGVRRAREVL